MAGNINIKGGGNVGSIKDCVCSGKINISGNSNVIERKDNVEDFNFKRKPIRYSVCPKGISTIEAGKTVTIVRR